MKANKTDMLAMLGGGQLGMFFVIAAQRLGFRVTVLDPDEKSPAGKIADVHLCADYSNSNALDKIIESCLFVTTEFENIPFSTLEYLEKKLVVRPSSSAVAVVQNRILEKTFLRDSGLPVGPFFVIESADDVDSAPKNIFPAILKVAQFGYDGKGQFHVNNIADLKDAYNQAGKVPCVLEKKLLLDLEVSVVLARDHNEQQIYFPVAENKHTNGILDISFSPARIPSDIASLAKGYAQQIAQKLNYIGVMAVEFFIVDEKLYVNEIAPRPHNSGHFTLDACVHNQFDLQVRTLTGLDLVDPQEKSNAIMVNILGDIWFKNGTYINPDFDILNRENNVNLHLYGKEKARKGRKMAHYTLTGDDFNKLLDKAKILKAMLSE
ncbi:5-(carboxyamino)imidazole ribonucleotide synthase [Methylophilaceae bacterium]|nr:5-(carboxyamino)imidazole ribonucleotide synthase [Methylophilaceae bacterium]MDC0128266.1 5-(carboxyamino)imidazole ribonucleotide synthase [Methylophilaceae bacterium]